MATPSDLLAYAAKDIGYSRWDDPKSGTKFGRWYADLVGNQAYAANGVAFCAMAASYWYAGISQSCPGLPEAYVPYIYNKAKKIVGVVLSNKYNAKPGDLILFDWGNDGSLNHTGIVELNKGSYLQTIEGNSPAGKVARHTRSWGTIKYIIRPVWDGDDPATTEDPRIIAVDGKWGGDTTYLAQLILDAPYKDRVISRQNARWRSISKGCTLEWQWLSKGYDRGSQTIRLLQRAWGMPDSRCDGLGGPDTWHYMIAYYQKRGSGATVNDERLDYPSKTIMQFQRELNAGRI